MPRRSRVERHLVDRVGWLRAAVLGANDGIISNASLIVGVAAAEASRSGVSLASVADLAAGAMSMAAGDHVSVSSQADAERADLHYEGDELATSPQARLCEPAGFYVARGLTQDLATQIATALTATDVLNAHFREELGISAHTTGRPIQAAFASAAAFAVGAALSLLVAIIAPTSTTVVAVTVSAILSLAILGAVGARMGGARIRTPIVCVTLWVRWPWR